MAAPKGNQFWRMRSSHGAKPKFDCPDKLWEACCEYFQWVEENPLNEEKLFAYQGDITRDSISKMRAMTISGLCLFLDICENTWAKYRENKDLMSVVTRAEKIIYNQKFAGAAADLLNPNIIARDLGLADRKEVSGKDGGAIETKDVSDMPVGEAARRVIFLLSSALKEQESEDASDSEG